jgi:hypothetical protein
VLSAGPATSCIFLLLTLTLSCNLSRP